MRSTDDRLARLAGLAEVWGHLYFYHPGLTVPDARWEAALETMIPQVEKAASADDFAVALNGGLLALLDDPWTVASATGVESLPSEKEEQPIDSAILPGGIGYIRCGSAAFELPYYPVLMKRAIDAVQGTDGVVLDLRWGRHPGPWPNLHRRPRFSTEDCWPSCIFGFFLDEAVPTPSRWERVHTGWSEEGWSHYGEAPRLRPGEPLQPIHHPPFFLEQRYPAVRFDTLPSHTGPVVVIVDDDAIGWLDHGLAALQQAGRGLVVHETEGRPRHRGEPLRVAGGVHLRTRPYRFVAEQAPDRTLFGCSDHRDAIAVAEELLGAIGPGGGERESAAPPETLRPAPGRAATTESSRERRMQGLLKTWAVLTEFFPHADLADIDWHHGLGDWIRRVEATQDTWSYYRVLLELAAHLNDSHSASPGIEHPAVEEILGTHTPPLRLGRVGDDVAVIEVHDAALEGSVPLGAVVTHVDGRPIAEIADDRSRLRSASTSQALDHWLYESGGVLAGSRDSEARITVVGEPGPSDVTVRRTIENRYWLVNRRPASERLENRFGYVDLTRVRTPDEFDVTLRELCDTAGLVLDMRGYPGFTVQTECVSRLIDRPVSSPRFEIPLRSASDRSAWHVSSYRIWPHSPSPYRAPVVVLIDAGTVSSAEDFCLCLRDTGRVTFVGRPTAGTDGNVTNLHLPDGGRFWFSGMRVLGVDGRPFQNVGIDPDILVPRTRSGVADGRDEILEAGTDALGRMADEWQGAGVEAWSR